MAEKLRKLFRNKKAVTPVLSNLLLTVVAVAVMALATTATYVITSNLRQTMSERVIIEDLWFNNSTASVDIYLRNVGQVAIEISMVYMNHTSQSFTGAVRFEIGAHDWSNVTQIQILNGTYYVDIVTTRGTHVGDYFVTP